MHLKVHILLGSLAVIVISLGIFFANYSISWGTLGYVSSVADYYFLRLLLKIPKPGSKKFTLIGIANVNILVIFLLFIVAYLVHFINFLVFAGFFILTRYVLVFASYKADNRRFV
jgi:hypothetical protein